MRLLRAITVIVGILSGCGGPGSGPVPGGSTTTNGGVFPPDNFWNTRIDRLPVHPRSADWVATIGAASHFHADFGSGKWDGGPIGIPLNIAGSDTPRFEVSFYYPDESDAGPYPIPANASREWGSDHHILVTDTTANMLYELYDASFDGSRWSAGSGAIWDLNSNNLRKRDWTSADLAGLPILPGLVRFDEVAAGRINHALRFCAFNTAEGYIWPARHPVPDLTGTDHTLSAPPMGARFRLKASYVIPSDVSPSVRIILQAMKEYGIVLADQGSEWYVSGCPDERWNNEELHWLDDNLAGAEFEAVDTSVLMIDRDSAACRAQ